MKKILVPTDFSENARNALIAAAQMSRVFNAEIILCAVYNQPSSGQSVLRDLSEQLKNNTLQDLQGEIDEIKPDFSDVDFRILAVKGDTADMITRTAQIEKADLIVMGKTGRSRLSNKLFGSVALATINKSQTPLVLIPESWPYNPIDKFCLATDLSEIDYPKALQPLIDFTRAYHAKIDVLHFAEDQDSLDEVYSNGSKAKKQIEDTLESVPHHFVFGIHEDVKQAIIRHIDTADFHMMCMIKHEYPWIHKAFSSSRTVDAAIHTKVPLLVLH